MVAGTRTYRNGDVLHCRDPLALCASCRKPQASGAGLGWFSLSGVYHFKDEAAGDAFGNHGNKLKRAKRSARRAQASQCCRCYGCNWVHALDQHSAVLVVVSALLVLGFGLAVLAGWALVGAAAAAVEQDGARELALCGVGILVAVGSCLLLGPFRRAAEGWGAGSLWQVPPLGLVTDAWSIVVLRRIPNVEADIRWDRPVSRMW